ncbi:MAG: DUF86 domain-containing protein [Planctomycetaceae bacterium]|jgi:uncharacterized protein with HEPN domain/predicted nucleotidyltransferase|nr:DUF86 domain-containing protein [Planctomycetaceae bacterium]
MPINTPLELESKLVELSPILCEKYNISQIGYFGSFSRNQQTDTSDIDILIDAPASKNYFDMSDELTEMFGREVQVVRKDLLLDEFRDSILEDVRFVDGDRIVGAQFPQPGDRRYMKEKRYDVYLKNMLERMLNIVEYVGSYRYEDLLNNDMALDAIEMCFSVIGEAAGKVPQHVREKYPSVPWTSMIQLRNIVVHDYDGVDYSRMWDTIKNDLPQNIIDFTYIVERETVKQ